MFFFKFLFYFSVHYLSFESFKCTENFNQLLCLNTVWETFFSTSHLGWKFKINWIINLFTPLHFNNCYYCTYFASLDYAGKTYIKLIKQWSLNQMTVCTAPTLNTFYCHYLICNFILWKESSFALRTNIFDIKVQLISLYFFPHTHLNAGHLLLLHMCFSATPWIRFCSNVVKRSFHVALLFHTQKVKVLTLCIAGQWWGWLLPHLGYMHGNAATDCAGGWWKSAG